MRKVFLLAAVFIFLGQAAVAYAHPPSDIKITYDPATKMVTAVIMHNVSNVLGHYIKKVDVAINGREVIEHQISRQDNNESQTVTYLLPDIKDGDVVSVEGYCSISGTLKKEITAKAAQ
jgi:hypothetical protein